MSDLNPSPRPQHSGSAFISKSPHAYSHQRRLSINSGTSHLYSIQETKGINTMENHLSPSLKPMTKKQAPNTKSLQYYLNSFHGQIDSIFDSSSTANNDLLLPQNKRQAVFGESANLPTRWIGVLAKSTILRFLLLLYVIFSVFLSLNHLWYWLTSRKLDARFGDQWIPQRTYEQDSTYSVMDDMTHGLKMSKVLAKANYETTDSTRPFWLKASEAPLTDDISLVTVVTPGTWLELERLAEHWKGPISAVLHMEQNTDVMTSIRQKYNDHADLPMHVDIHLSLSTRPGVSVLLPLNAERNLGRLFARTDFVTEMPSNVVPATDIRHTLETNKDMFSSLLHDGDVLVVPVFGFTEQDSAVFKLPHSKTRLLELVNGDAMLLLDKHWKPNTGPTDLDAWKSATTLYPVKRYDFHYEPIVIENKNVQPWCAERFLDSRSACLFSSYLAGGELWVLPDDFMVELPETEKSTLSDFNNVIENRLYAKFYWEQCVYHARQLDALGFWKDERSQHIRTQCSRVIQNWGKGLVGKPE